MSLWARRPQTHHNRLRQVPDLSYSAVAIPDLEPCAIGGAPAGDVKAATRLGVYEAALVSPVPLLGTGAVAVAKIDLRPIGGTATCDVHALAEALSGPSPLFQVQFCELVPLHMKIWIAVPLFVAAPASSMHLPALPRIGPASRYFALTTDGVSRS